MDYSIRGIILKMPTIPLSFFRNIPLDSIAFALPFIVYGLSLSILLVDSLQDTLTIIVFFIMSSVNIISLILIFFVLSNYFASRSIQPSKSAKKTESASVPAKKTTEDRLEEKKKQQQKLKRKRSEGESLPLY
jgi:hypothetical protein